MEDGGKIDSSTFGIGNAGSVNIIVRDSLIFDGVGLNALLPNGTFGQVESGAFSRVEPGAVGNAGGVTIESGSVEVTNGAIVSAATLGRGDAGSVNITARDTIIFDGQDLDGFPSGAFSEVEEGATGNAGGVSIETASLEVTNGAEISSSTLGRGNAGSVEIAVSEAARFDGGGVFSTLEAGGAGSERSEMWPGNHDKLPSDDLLLLS